MYLNVDILGVETTEMAVAVLSGFGGCVATDKGLWRSQLDASLARRPEQRAVIACGQVAACFSEQNRAWSFKVSFRIECSLTNAGLSRGRDC